MTPELFDKLKGFGTPLLVWTEQASKEYPHDATDLKNYFRLTSYIKKDAMFYISVLHPFGIDEMNEAELKNGYNELILRLNLSNTTVQDGYTSLQFIESLLTAYKQDLTNGISKVIATDKQVRSIAMGYIFTHLRTIPKLDKKLFFKFANFWNQQYIANPFNIHFDDLEQLPENKALINCFKWYSSAKKTELTRLMEPYKEYIFLVWAKTEIQKGRLLAPEPSTLRSAESLFANERFNQVLRLARGNKPDFDKFIKFYVEKRFENTSSTIKDIIDTYPYKLPTDNAVRAWINGKGTKKTNGAKGFLNHFKEVFKENLEDFF